MDDQFATRKKIITNVTLAGSFVSFVLTITKIIFGIIGKSQALIADGIHSLSDLGTDFITICGSIFSNKPIDEDHNYGHGKIETLVSFIEGLVLFGVGLLIFKNGSESIYKVLFKNYSIPVPNIITIFIAILSIVSKEILYNYTIFYSKKVDSTSLNAKAWHHRSDAFSSIGVAVGIGGAIILGNKWTILDPIASLVVSFLIIRVAIDIIKSSVNELVEVSLPKEQNEKIYEIAHNTEGVENTHKLRTRKVGTNIVIDLQIIINGDKTIREGHKIAHKVVDNLKKEFGNEIIVNTHVEPHLN